MRAGIGEPIGGDRRFDPAPHHRVTVQPRGSHGFTSRQPRPRGNERRLVFHRDLGTGAKPVDYLEGPSSLDDFPSVSREAAVAVLEAARERLFVDSLAA